MLVLRMGWAEVCDFAVDILVDKKYCELLLIRAGRIPCSHFDSSIVVLRSEEGWFFLREFLFIFLYTKTRLALILVAIRTKSDQAYL